jgi:4-hydroxy-4-methyl-2-oxoglutarate aldolase
MSAAVETPSGATIRLVAARAGAATVDQARILPAATLHEAGGRIGALPSAIKPMTPGLRVCGPAVTVHSPAGDNLWLHRAIYLASPGDVLVVSVGGDFEYGYWGEIMSTAAKVRHLGGLVIDGCVRDGRLLAEIGFPVFARGLCIRGTGKDHGAIGFVNHAIRVGEVTVSAGDLIVGDEDGVVALPHAQAASIVQTAATREAKEADILRRIEAGERTLEVYNFG